MAIQLEKENSKFNIYEQHFLIDSAADLQTLESEYNCHQGDKAELSDGSYYLRHSDDYQGELWELAKSSGGSLPSVTSSDNGNVLTVVNGAWDKAAPGGGMFVVEVVEIDEETTEVNKTGNEILAAMRAKIPICRMDNFTVDAEEYQLLEFGAYYSYSEGVHHFDIGKTSYETDDLSKRPRNGSK